MARLLFEMQSIRTRRGPLATGTSFVVYTDAAGTALADISATSGGSAIAGSQVTVADIAGLGPSALRFYGPDGVDTLYLRSVSDASLGVQEIEADEDERLDALEAGGGGAHPNLAVHDTLGLATDAELAAHNADTTAVHGISDTSAVATSSSVATAVGIHSGAVDPHGDRAYTDSVAQGLDVKASVRVASTADLTLSGEQTIDGVLTSADRVLVKNQAAGADNGVYVSAAGAWARAADANTAAEVGPGMFTFVEEGTVNGGTGWVQTTPEPITLGTTALVFSQFSSGGTILGGAGLVKTGNTLDVVAGTGLAVASDTVGIAPGGVTNTQVDASAAIAESKLALAFPTHAEDHAARHAAAGGDPLAGYVLESAHTSAAHDTLGLVTDAILAAHEADTTSIHGIADTAKIALEPHSDDRVLYVSRAIGSDSNDGLSWGSAKRTIQAALNALSGNGATINISSGAYDEHINITRDGVKLVGNPNPLGGTRIKPTTVSATVVNVTGHSGTVLEDISIHAQLTDFNGIGFNINNSHSTKLIRCGFQGFDGLATATTGGIALKMEGAEGCLIDSFFAAESRIAINLVNEATENVFINTKGASNYQEWIIEGNCGGNSIFFSKFNNCKDAPGVDTNVLGGNGQFWWHPDFSETGAASGSRILVSASRQLFISGTCAPQSTWTITGDRCVFQHFRILNDFVIDAAADSVLMRDCSITGSGAVLNNGGTNTVIDRLWTEGGVPTITYGSAAAPAYRRTGGALATNSTSGFLYIPTCAGTPTGTPVAETGMVPLVFDTTANKLWIFDDGAWKGGTVPGVFS